MRVVRRLGMVNGWFYIVIFTIAYLGSVAAAMWINIPMLCLGDQKFDGGCGGFMLYYSFWALSYSPLVVTALIFVRPSKLVDESRIRNLLLCVYLGFIVLALEVSFINDFGWPGLLINWVILGVLFYSLRSFTLSKLRGTT